MSDAVFFVICMLIVLGFAGVIYSDLAHLVGHHTNRKKIVFVAIVGAFVLLLAFGCLLQLARMVAAALL